MSSPSEFLTFYRTAIRASTQTSTRCLTKSAAQRPFSTTLPKSRNLEDTLMGGGPKAKRNLEDTLMGGGPKVKRNLEDTLMGGGPKVKRNLEDTMMGGGPPKK